MNLRGSGGAEGEGLVSNQAAGGVLACSGHLRSAADARVSLARVSLAEVTGVQI